jgi:UDP-glucose 4-epimerase
LAHTGVEAVNLGTGNGYSVLQIVAAFEKASGVKINSKIVARREGDIAVCYAEASKAKSLLGWEAKLGIDRMCEDTWRFNKNNPQGL